MSAANASLIAAPAAMTDQALPSCNCIDLINASEPMTKSNTVLLFNLIGPPRTFIATYTEKRIRGCKPPHVQATYCPFCGVKYPVDARSTHV